MFNNMKVMQMFKLSIKIKFIKFSIKTGKIEKTRELLSQES